MPNTAATTSTDALGLLIERWRNDLNATYQSWFLWEERLKNFRSIRRGLRSGWRRMIGRDRSAAVSLGTAVLWKFPQTSAASREPTPCG